MTIFLINFLRLKHVITVNMILTDSIPNKNKKNVQQIIQRVKA